MNLPNHDSLLETEPLLLLLLFVQHELLSCLSTSTLDAGVVWFCTSHTCILLFDASVSIHALPSIWPIVIISQAFALQRSWRSGPSR